MTTRRCRCGHWHPKRDDVCPKCKLPVPAFNKALRTGSLNSHLFGMAERA